MACREATRRASVFLDVLKARHTESFFPNQIADHAKSSESRRAACTEALRAHQQSNRIDTVKSNRRAAVAIILPLSSTDTLHQTW